MAISSPVYSLLSTAFTTTEFTTTEVFSASPRPI